MWSVDQRVPNTTDPPSDDRAIDPDAVPPEVVDAIVRALSEHREHDPTIPSETYLNIIEIEIERLQLLIQSQPNKNPELAEIKGMLLKKIMAHLQSRQREKDGK
jgi:hypothetical protein